MMKTKILIYITLVFSFICSSCEKKKATEELNTPVQSQYQTPSTPAPNFHPIVIDNNNQGNNYVPNTYVESEQEYTDSGISPDDAYDEGYEQGEEDGRYDAEHGYDRGHSYDDSNDYYGYYEDQYVEGYEEGYDDAYRRYYTEPEDNE